MDCGSLIRILEKQAPEACACDWDNVGLLVGRRDKEVERVFVAVDATDEAIREAKEAHADLFLSHHPLIFKGIRHVTAEDFIGRRVIELVKGDMAYYAMHTNFDICGMAQLAAEKLGLQDAKTLQPQAGASSADGEALGIGTVGDLPTPMTLRECVGLVKEAFCVEAVKLFALPGAWEQEGCADILRIAVCPGSGKGVIGDALKARAQVLVTGDIDHHEGIDAAACGMTVIDAGHYGVEKMFVPYIKGYLEAEVPALTVIAEKPKQPFVIV